MESRGIKGVILAAGKGIRLRPLTEITNKMLLPVFDRPMITGPIEALRGAGITEICLVTNKDHIEDFKSYLGDGSKFGVKITYAIQHKMLGIGDALLTAESFAKGSKVALYLGDNVFESLEIPKEAWADECSYIFIKEVSDPRPFGVAEIKDRKVINIEEKPENPKTNHVVTGFYIFPGDVFEVAKHTKPSARGEVEVTEVINHYIKYGNVRPVKIVGYWLDVGSFDALLKAALLRGLSNSPALLSDIDRDSLIKSLKGKLACAEA